VSLPVLLMSTVIEAILLVKGNMLLVIGGCSLRLRCCMKADAHLRWTAMLRTSSCNNMNPRSDNACSLKHTWSILVVFCDDCAVFYLVFTELSLKRSFLRRLPHRDLK
jgi:hypothetical protein